MIIDNQTNTVYFSEWLKIDNRFIPFWRRLEPRLKERNIDYRFLPAFNENDIWVRDYMPIQINANTFVKYKYTPDYLKDKKWLNTDSEKILSNSDIISDKYEFNKTDLILDGGNIIKTDNKIILTDKIFTENCFLKMSETHKVSDEKKDSLVKNIKKEFQVEKVVIIPRLTNDYFGHADGMLRFIDNNCILLNDDTPLNYYSKDFIKILEKVHTVLLENEFKVINQVPHCYYENNFFINYLQIAEFVFLPTFCNNKLNEIAIKIFGEFFGKGNVIPISAMEIEKEGGGLNCISWTIKI